MWSVRDNQTNEKTIMYYLLWMLSNSISTKSYCHIFDTGQILNYIILVERNVEMNSQSYLSLKPFWRLYYLIKQWKCTYDKAWANVL